MSRLTGQCRNICWAQGTRAGWGTPSPVISAIYFNKYETLVYDIDAATVEYVCDDRKQESLESYYRQFSIDELDKVMAIAMDMWDPYIKATKAYVPGADKKIVCNCSAYFLQLLPSA